MQRPPAAASAPVPDGGIAAVKAFSGEKLCDYRRASENVTRMIADEDFRNILLYIFWIEFFFPHLYCRFKIQH